VLRVSRFQLLAAVLLLMAHYRLVKLSASS
jgi:hypothetical protein